MFCIAHYDFRFLLSNTMQMKRVHRTSSRKFESWQEVTGQWVCNIHTCRFTGICDFVSTMNNFHGYFRAIFEKSMQAFVSYVQAYAKHECNLLFRFKGELVERPISRFLSEIK